MDQSLRASLQAVLAQARSYAELKLEQGLPCASGWPVATQLHMRAAQAVPAGPAGLVAVASLQGAFPASSAWA